MRIHLRTLIVALLLSPAQFVHCDESPVVENAGAHEPSRRSSENLRNEMTRLIQADAAAIKKASKPVPEASASSTTDEPASDLLILDPLRVREKRTPDLPPALHEVPLNKFFRTGTIAQKIGRKTTTRFWASGDRGLMLSFSR